MCVMSTTDTSESPSGEDDTTSIFQSHSEERINILGPNFCNFDCPTSTNIVALRPNQAQMIIIRTLHLPKREI